MQAEESASFTTKILLSMVAGIIVGVILNVFFVEVAFIKDNLVNGVLHIVGAVFVALLKMMVVPLVFVSLVCGVASLGDVRGAGGAFGIKTIALYLLTTAVAITIALSLAFVHWTRRGI